MLKIFGRSRRERSGVNQSSCYIDFKRPRRAKYEAAYNRCNPAKKLQFHLAVDSSSFLRQPIRKWRRLTHL